MCNDTVTDIFGGSSKKDNAPVYTAPPPPPAAAPTRNPREHLLNEKEKELKGKDRRKRKRLGKEDISTARRGRSALRIPLAGSGSGGSAGLNIAS